MPSLHIKVEAIVNQKLYKALRLPYTTIVLTRKASVRPAESLLLEIGPIHKGGIIRFIFDSQARLL